MEKSVQALATICKLVPRTHEILYIIMSYRIMQIVYIEMEKSVQALATICKLVPRTHEILYIIM